MSQHAAMLAWSALSEHAEPPLRIEEAGAALAPVEAPRTGWTLRRAGPDDEPRIRALVRAERLNPTDLRFPTFIVACVDERVVGAAQIRLHRDGSRELGSLVVAPAFRRRGIGTALICSLLAQESRQLHVITGHAGVPTYERHGFRQVPGRSVPRIIRRNLRIGQFVGHCRRLRGVQPLGLCVLERPEQSILGAIHLS